MEYNPYEPPKAPVADRARLELPRSVRVLRMLAVIGSSMTGLISLVVPFAVPGSKVQAVLMIAAWLFMLSLTSIVALVFKNAGRRIYWAAMASNTIAILVLNLGGRPGPLLFVVPALLNMAAIELLRRARMQLLRA